MKPEARWDLEGMLVDVTGGDWGIKDGKMTQLTNGGHSKWSSKKVFHLSVRMDL